jgi:hypothetical protein
MLTVILAKARISLLPRGKKKEIPAFAGMTIKGIGNG